MDGVEPQLKAHFALALNVGLTQEQLTELLSILDTKVDKAKSLKAQEALRDVLQAKDDKR
jgi:alkylhydroperoxidase/carboxymuconolactone decarboxylase family protein YurZ